MSITRPNNVATADAIDVDSDPSSLLSRLPRLRRSLTDGLIDIPGRASHQHTPTGLRGVIDVVHFKRSTMERDMLVDLSPVGTQDDVVAAHEVVHGKHGRIALVTNEGNSADIVRRKQRPANFRGQILGIRSLVHAFTVTLFRPWGQRPKSCLLRPEVPKSRSIVTLAAAPPK
jgi:hypothetical protein